MVRRLHVLALVLAGMLSSHWQRSFAGDKEPAKGVLARTRSAIGAIWRLGKEPQALELYKDVLDGDHLLTPPGQRGTLDVKEGDLRVTLVGNLPELSPSRSLETVVKVLDGGKDDVRVELDRGIVVFETGKDSAATLSVSAHGKTWRLALSKSSAAAVEAVRFCPLGASFFEDSRITETWLLVLRGSVELATEDGRQTISGPHVFRAGAKGALQGPFELKQTPLWAAPHKIEKKEALTVLNASEKIRIAKGGWQEALASKDENVRRAALFNAVAFDQPKAALTALEEDTSRLVRRGAVTALRHFACRGMAEAKNLHTTLLAEKFKTGQAAIFMHLLAGFKVADRNRPETYETLIGYLMSDQQAIRELASEELLQLVPAGKDITFDAAAPAEARREAQAAWRKLIPEGTLPQTK